MKTTIEVGEIMLPAGISWWYKEFDEMMKEYAREAIKADRENLAKLCEREWCSDGYSTGMWKEVIEKKDIINAPEIELL